MTEVNRSQPCPSWKPRRRASFRLAKSMQSKKVLFIFYHILPTSLDYPSYKYAFQHQLKVHAERNLKCKHCPKTFAISYLLKQHEDQCNELVSCDQCGLKFLHQSSLRRHQKSSKHGVPFSTRCVWSSRIPKFASAGAYFLARTRAG